MPTIKVTDATIEPITLAEAKLWTRIDIADEDTFFEQICLPAARQEAERRMNRSILTTTWKLQLDAFPDCPCIRLHWPVLQRVTHLKYYDADGVLQTMDPASYDADGVLQTMDPASYVLDTTSEPARLCLAPSLSWPATQTGRVNAVEVVYVSGWDAAAKVPAPIKQWVALFAATLFNNRELLTTAGSVAELKFADGLLDGHKIWNV